MAHDDTLLLKLRSNYKNELALITYHTTGGCFVEPRKTRSINLSTVAEVE